MKIDEVRIYFEVLEQGEDLKHYVINAMEKLGVQAEIKLIYSKKIRGEFCDNESLVTRIRKVKDIDVMITIISGNYEIPVSLIEYSTAVRTDDHIMQRSDVIFWGANYKIPTIKISPETKGVNAQHGGGSKITDSIEKRAALKNNAIYFTIKWQSNEDDLLIVNPERLSCIAESEELHAVIHLMFDTIISASGHYDYYEILLSKYKHIHSGLLTDIGVNEVKNMFCNSSRFNWNNDTAIVKINRFGHALDPDRGIVYFMNMLLSYHNLSAEFQVERTSLNNRMGYKSLFDGISHQRELYSYVNDIFISQHNRFTAENALFVFLRGLNLDSYFYGLKIEGNTVFIPDEMLNRYLAQANGFAVKSIFILSKSILLTDNNRKLILEIKYNHEPIFKYLSTLSNYNYEITDTSLLDSSKINEDIVSYASMMLFKKANLDILAISYPGAQGDRCILHGEGRNVLREYIDIISYKIDVEGNIHAYLHEAKDYLSKSGNDVIKLNEIRSNPELKKGFTVLTLKILKRDTVSEINIGIGGKGPCPSRFTNLDYIMLFDINSDSSSTIVDWSIAAISRNVMDDFSLLLNSNNALKGSLNLGKIYVII